MSDEGQFSITISGPRSFKTRIYVADALVDGPFEYEWASKDDRNRAMETLKFALSDYYTG